MFLNENLQKVLDEIVDEKNVFNASFAVQKDDFLWAGKAGKCKSEQPFFIASITKMFVTAVIMQLIHEKKLSLNSLMVEHLENSDVIRSLHIHKNRDYTHKITIKHLLSHTSGLPDYFQTKLDDGKTLRQKLISGEDVSWSFEDVINWTKNSSSKFPPGAKNKTNYSATNYQILGKIVERITGKTLSENLQKRVFEPLKLSQTYIYSDVNDKNPLPIYHKQRILHNPRAIISSYADGAGVSTSKDLLIFIQKFFDGTLFPKFYLQEMTDFKRIFYPLKAGVGFLRFEVGIFSFFKIMPSMFGHSGLPGALVYADLNQSLFIAGTLNQTANHSLPFITMAKLLAKLK